MPLLAVSFLFVPALALAQSATSCPKQYNRIAISFKKGEAAVQKVDLPAVAKASGGYRELARRDEEDRTHIAGDADVPGKVKDRVLPWLDENIKAAQCWADLAPQVAPKGKK